MLSYCTNYLATMPDITVYMNCDTRLAINLRAFNLSEKDEFIFAIKNYNYIDSPCVFLFRAKKEDMDENGEVLFKIPPTASKHVKPGAFYNFALLINAFDPKQETEYRKLTDNGNIIIEYGAHDLTIETESYGKNCEVISVRLELLDHISSVTPSSPGDEIVGVRLELLDEISSVYPGRFYNEIVGMHLELLDALPSVKPNGQYEEIISMHLEPID